MKKIKNIKMILFDVDNTLIYGKEANLFYTQYGRVLEKTLAKELGIKNSEAKIIADAFRFRFNGSGEISFEALNIGIDVWYKAICSIDPNKYLNKMDKTIEILSTLKQKYILGAITDGPTKQAYKILSVAGIDTELFDFIIGWEIGKKMPKGGKSDVFKKVCRENNISPENALMVGDSLHCDINPALKVGLNAIHITNKKVEKEKKYYQINNIEELIEILK